jgi:DNA-binding response OmpR family regulator
MADTMRDEIVVVEDERGVADVLRRRLEFAGFAVHIEGCGNAALNYLAAHHPSLVILDLRLPDISGYEVCRKLRQVYHPWDVPILMLTAMDRPIDKLRGFAQGADAYLTKPYDAKELLETIALLLGDSVPS